MAFEVGAIVSKLTLDTQKWSQSVTKVEGDQTKMRGGAKRTSESFRKMGIAMVAAGTAITAALGTMVKKYVEVGDWIDKMSKRTGISAEALSELAYAADLSGASLTDVERSVKRMAGSILDAHGGLESYARAFRQMGLSVDELMKMNPEEQFLAISEAIATIEDPTIRAALAQDVFGRAGTALLPMMAEGKEGLKAMRQEARDLGIIYTTKTAQGAADLKDAQTALKESLRGLSMVLVEHLVPILTKLVKGVTDFITKVKDWARENEGLVRTIVSIAGVAAPMAAVMGSLLLIVGKLQIATVGLKAKLIGLVSTTNILVAALAALVIGYMKVKQAQDRANESARRSLEVEGRLAKKLKEATEAVGIHGQAFHELLKKYKYSPAAMAMAIKAGKEGKELQEALANATSEAEKEIAKQTETVDASVPVFQGYLTELEKTGEATKTWLDYLKEQGVMTIEQKRDRVDELEGYLQDLDQAYRDGKITLEDYLRVANKTKGEIKDLSTVLTSTAIPAARDMSAVYQQAVSEMETKTGDFKTTVETKTTEVENQWLTVTERIRDAWSRELGEMLSGAKSFKDAAGAVWDELKRMFFDMVAQMVTKWVFGFVQKMITSTLTSTTSVASQLTSTATNIIKQVGSWSPGGIVGSVIGGAISGLFSGIFGGKGMSKSTAKHIHQIVDHTAQIRDTLRIDMRDRQFNWMLDHLAHIREFTGDRIVLKQDAQLNRLDKIKGYLHDLVAIMKKTVSAQEGAVVTDTRLAVLHGTRTDPEIAAPLSKLGGIGGSSTLNKNVAVNIYVANQLNPNDAQRIVREQIVPQMLRAIEVDPRNKTEMRRIMGIER